MSHSDVQKPSFHLQCISHQHCQTLKDTARKPLYKQFLRDHFHCFFNPTYYPKIKQLISRLHKLYKNVPPVLNLQSIMPVAKTPHQSKMKTVKIIKIGIKYFDKHLSVISKIHSVEISLGNNHYFVSIQYIKMFLYLNMFIFKQIWKINSSTARAPG